MKLQRMQAARQVPLWVYVTHRLPRSLVTQEKAAGYGRVCFVYRRGEEPGPIARWFFDGDPVARISDDHIDLYSPEYMSDFQDLIRGYEESHRGPDIVLRYWES